MSPLAILALMWAATKARTPAYVPSSVPTANVPPGAAVTTMLPGQHYRVTLLFRGLGPGTATPTPDILASSANAAASPPGAFVADPSQTHVVQNADGSWAAQVVGLFVGPSVTFDGQAWSLLQMQAA